MFRRLFKDLSRMSSQKVKSTLVSLSKLDTKEARFVKPVLIEYNLDGEKILKWEAILAHDSVAVILYNKTTNKLVFVKQFRPAVMMSSIYSSTGEKREKPLKSDGYTLVRCCWAKIERDPTCSRIQTN